MSARPAARRRARAASVAVALLGCAVMSLGTAPGAAAHPLGNATVNHYDGLVLRPDRITDTAVEDVAEIPTLQRRPLVDADGDGGLSSAELARYAQAQCASLAAAVRLTVGARRLTWQVTRAAYGERPGAIGLPAGRLVCELAASAHLSDPTTVAIDDQWDGAGIGWHEVTAVGAGVVLHDSPVPARSISDELRAYPGDLLSSPLDQRSARLAVTPGAGASTYAGVRDLPAAGAATRWLAGLTRTFDDLVGRRNLGVGIGLLAVLLAMALGAGHAFLPGHGKTIMAAYLVGRRGRLSDVVTVGATVTLTHTAGVLAIGLLLSLSATLAPTAVVQDLSVVSGLIVAAVGVWLLVTALRRSRSREVQAQWAELEETAATQAHPDPAATEAHPDPAPVLAAAAGSSPGGVVRGHALDHQRGLDHEHGMDHEHVGDPRHGVDPHRPVDDQRHGDVHHREHSARGENHPALPHEQAHRHGLLGHSHSHSHSHSHTHAVPAGPSGDPGTGPQGFSRTGLLGLGFAGGLVPSPSALLVLLAAVALGRTVFGVALVLAYGVGMAAALTAAGLVLVRLRDRLGRLAAGRRLQRFGRVLAALPVLTACLVVVVGFGLVVQALGGSV